MNILLVGALSWNAERLRSLAERGHQLWGVWSRSMAWDQGPYPALADCITPLSLADAAPAIRTQRIDCVYSLFQVYHQRLWAAARPGVEHDVWTLLRALLAERENGRIDVPFVRHWGFDVQQIDREIARAFDANIFCNSEKLAYWTEPVARGGCGIDVFGDHAATEFLDSDRPKLEFMNDDFADPLSRRTGEVHTVCIGRPFGIDYLAAARHGIHVHTYGNSVDDVYRMIARDLPLSTARREARLLRRFIHVHPSLQATGTTWDEVRRAKAAWVREFSRYDAAWSYIGSPLPWEPLDDRAAIPNRVSTYLLAGLPVITDRRPGYYRYDELVRVGANVDLVDGNYDDLAARLDNENRTRVKRTSARQARAEYSFDASIDRLVSTLERARDAYFARPPRERSHFVSRPTHLVHFNTSPDPRTMLRGVRRRLLVRQTAAGSASSSRTVAVLSALCESWRSLVTPRKARLLAGYLGADDQGTDNWASATVANAAAPAAAPGATATPAPAPEQLVDVERERK